MDALTRARECFMAALAAQGNGDLARATQLLREALALAPGRVSIRINLAGVLIAQGQSAEARALCAGVLAGHPDEAQAWVNLALCEMHEDAPEAALAAIERALALTGADAGVHANHGNILMLLGRNADALVAFERACACAPADPAWQTARGSALRMLERLDEAAAAHHEALRLAPGHADAHWNLGLVALARGDHATGWHGFEARWRSSDPVIPAYTGDAPRWRGEALAPGEALLLFAEQGLGDTLQFFRYATVLAGRGVDLIVQVQAPLVSLLQAHDARVRVIAQGAALPQHARQFPLLSLPWLLGTRADSIPPALDLRVPETARKAWEARLGARVRPRIGLMWAGSQANRIGRTRSMPAVALAPLLALAADFFFIGKEAAPAELAWLGGHANFHDHSACVDDFVDTAAQICAMDRVLSIDTSVAHLAAQLGRPTWLMLAAGADWRWGQGVDASPWYPAQTRLFRQAVGEDWRGVIGAVREALAPTLEPGVKT